MSSSPYPILEITLLTSNPSSTPTSILTQLQNVRTLLAEKVLPTHSRFYHSKVTNEIYILGFWPSLKSHTDFLADAKLSHEILSPQRDVLDWKWTGHVKLNGRSVDDVRRKLEGMKMIKVERWVVDVSSEDTFLSGLGQLGSEGSTTTMVAGGWGVDSETNGKTEYIRIRGRSNFEGIETASRVHQSSLQEASPRHQHNVDEVARRIYFDME